MGPAASLSEIDTEILKLLWFSVFVSGGVGASIENVAERLTARGIKRSRSDLQRHHLNRLISAELIMVAGKSQTNSRGGDKPSLYCVNRFTTITWTSTATMLVEVKKRRQVEQAELMEELVQAKLIDSATNKPIKAESLAEQIASSKAWKYIGYVNKTVLWPLPRVDFELDYLKFVADPPSSL